jgi:ribonuclease D
MTWRLATLSDVPTLRAELSSAPRIGIDTEFHAERRWLPQLYLVQFAVEGGHTWVVDPMDANLFREIADVLASPTWILHGGQQDLRVLVPICGRLPPAVLDTQIAAAFAGHRFPANFAEVLSRWLGQAIEKGETMSDWSKRPLTAEQLEYAASDVAWLLALWDRLAEHLEAHGRTRQCEQACADQANLALETVKPDWRRIPAVAVLDRTQAACLRELVAWREEVARITDTPSRVLVADALLADLARKMPESRQALSVNRRLSKSLVRDFSDGLLGAIARARALPPEQRPEVIRHGSAASRRLAFLGAVAEILGDAEGWAHGLVLPRPLLEQIAIDPPADRPALAGVLGPWRDEIAGNALFDCLTGARGLRLRGGEPGLEG